MTLKEIAEQEPAVLTYPAVALQTFLETDFEGGRHERRVEKLSALDRP